MDDQRDDARDANTQPIPGEQNDAGPLDPAWEAAGTTVVGRWPVTYTFPTTGAPEGTLTAGVPLVTVDGETLGTIGAVAADRIKVSAPLAADYWLPISHLAGIAPGGDIVVSVPRDQIDRIKVGPPESS
jgi:hypothetical protein